MDTQAVIEATRRWIADVVIGQNLCPFAQRVFLAEKIRYVVSTTEDDESLVKDLAAELDLLVSTPMEEIETTLVIHPRLLNDFLAYNDFLDVAERLLRTKSLQGIIQIASFHPHYQFAGTRSDAAENYTNRSPYPMLHLLREESITAVAADSEELLAIPTRNIARLQALGKDKLAALLRAITAKRHD